MHRAMDHHGAGGVLHALLAHGAEQEAGEAAQAARPNDSRAYGVVKAASIDTNEPTRDEHLRSPDFLDVERFPEIRFESKRIEPSVAPTSTSSAT